MKTDMNSVCKHSPQLDQILYDVWSTFRMPWYSIHQQLCPTLPSCKFSSSRQPSWFTTMQILIRLKSSSLTLVSRWPLRSPVRRSTSRIMVLSHNKASKPSFGGAAYMVDSPSELEKVQKIPGASAVTQLQEQAGGGHKYLSCCGYATIISLVYSWYILGRILVRKCVTRVEFDS